MDEPHDINGVRWKLKTFYRSCMNVYNYMKDWLEPLRRQIVTGLCEYWSMSSLRECWGVMLKEGGSLGSILKDYSGEGDGGYILDSFRTGRPVIGPPRQYGE